MAKMPAPARGAFAGEHLFKNGCYLTTSYSSHAGAVADDFYHLYPIDIAAMQLLGVKHFRFSISWPRIIPDGDGPVNQKGLEFYARLLDALHAAGIEPLVCLYHWDLPQVSCLVHVPSLGSILMCQTQRMLMDVTWLQAVKMLHADKWVMWLLCIEQISMKHLVLE